ncbi:HNH endonuclease signature motif containing protein [Ralstonia pseudosolanacearum]|uniref:HNH endonuclease n=1 Tax=Ralstonia pseudosolanacearum TaxID=1310165 RepID=UPI0026758758|nr:HNH endonuclease signature motif containing protein [Ralstonia pseudosolanacearum]MDO3515186.1 HNH endonuclease signature motif containing protein [Ralstonia pseudosolanacearum]MDO3634006.1 HNH endonuclease signature motif containing protein [Ralstonia pseudosolanacearum]
MGTVLGIAVLVGIYILWQFLMHLLDEWGGVYGRWRRGEPLRASGLRVLRWRAELERRERRKVELRQRHDLNPHLILDRDFRREFEDLDIDAEIYAEVIAASGNRCAACGRQFSQRRRKPLLHIDHIRPRKLYPHLLYVRSNLQVLCRSCNSHKSAYDGDDWRDVVAARRRATNKKRRTARARKSLDA